MAGDKPEATYADLEALPDNVVGEIIDGELIVSPRPRPKHMRAEGVIYADLHGPFDRGRGGPGGWWLLVEPEVHLGKSIVSPDIVGWRRERMAELPDEVGITVVPDWLCEVLSPSTARTDRRKKMRLYARHRVGHVWLVDPIERILEVYRRSDAGWVLVDTYGDDDRARIEPFDSVELDLSGWWTGPPPRGAAEMPLTWQPTNLEL